MGRLQMVSEDISSPQGTGYAEVENEANRLLFYECKTLGIFGASSLSRGCAATRRPARPRPPSHCSGPTGPDRAPPEHGGTGSRSTAPLPFQDRPRLSAHNFALRPCPTPSLTPTSLRHLRSRCDAPGGLQLHPPAPRHRPRRRRHRPGPGPGPGPSGGSRQRPHGGWQRWQLRQMCFCGPGAGH